MLQVGKGYQNLMEGIISDHKDEGRSEITRMMLEEDCSGRSRV